MCSYRVEQDHALIHNFEVLSHEHVVTSKFTSQGAHLIVLDLDQEAVTLRCVLSLDDQVAKVKEEKLLDIRGEE